MGRTTFSCLTILALGMASPPESQQPSVESEIPRRIASPSALYPEAAARKRLRGPVVVQLSIDREGRVVRARALTGDRQLVPAALTAVGKWRFEPTGKAQRMLAGINIGPRDPAAAPHLSPPAVFGRGGRPGAFPPGTVGRASVLLTLTAAGRVVDALGLSGPDDVLVEALDTALRWTTPPLASDETTTFVCRAEWLNGYREFAAPKRDTLLEVGPEFSDAARAQSGSTPALLEAIVAPDGVVKDVKLLRSNPALDDEAERAVRLWRFAPFFLNGMPSSSFSVVAIRAPGRPGRDKVMFVRPACGREHVSSTARTAPEPPGAFRAR